MLSRLLEFVNDPFISELLLGITKFMAMVENRDLQAHALERAKTLVSQIKQFHAQSVESGDTIAEPNYRKYKELSLSEKVQCLITADDIAKLQKEFEVGVTKNLFQITFSRIVRVLRYNYLGDF